MKSAVAESAAGLPLHSFAAHRCALRQSFCLHLFVKIYRLYNPLEFRAQSDRGAAFRSLSRRRIGTIARVSFFDLLFQLVKVSLDTTVKCLARLSHSEESLRQSESGSGLSVLASSAQNHIITF